MAKKSILGLFRDADSAANGVDSLKDAGFPPEDYDILSGTPYPEGAFGEVHAKHRLFIFPLIGALLGLSVAIVLTSTTQIAYPLVTGGKPILSIPAMAIVSYEGTMLGAIIFTVIGIVFESRLPRLFMGAYDDSITEGAIGVAVTTSQDRVEDAEKVLNKAGAERVKRGWEKD